MKRAVPQLKASSTLFDGGGKMEKGRVTTEFRCGHQHFRAHSLQVSGDEAKKSSSSLNGRTQEQVVKDNEEE